MHLKLIAGALMAIATTQPALAQDIKMSPKQAEQLACISDWLVKDKKDVLVADVYARGDQEGKDHRASNPVHDDENAECDVGDGQCG